MLPSPLPGFPALLGRGLPPLENQPTGAAGSAVDGARPVATCVAAAVAVMPRLDGSCAS